MWSALRSRADARCLVKLMAAWYLLLLLLLSPRAHANRVGGLEDALPGCSAANQHSQQELHHGPVGPAKVLRSCAHHGCNTLPSPSTVREVSPSCCASTCSPLPSRLEGVHVHSACLQLTRVRQVSENCKFSDAAPWAWTYSLHFLILLDFDALGVCAEP